MDLNPTLYAFLINIVCTYILSLWLILKMHKTSILKYMHYFDPMGDALIYIDLILPHLQQEIRHFGNHLSSALSWSMQHPSYSHWSHETPTTITNIFHHESPNLNFPLLLTSPTYVVQRQRSHTCIVTPLNTLVHSAMMESILSRTRDKGHSIHTVMDQSKTMHPPMGACS